jgi:hypothetical protein
MDWRSLSDRSSKGKGSFFMEEKTYFNEPKVNLNDLSLFPADIYERTKRNPNPKFSIQCQKNTNSLDDYAKRLAQELITALKS